MKKRNILRVFFVAIFVLGTMAMNAQSKVYIHKVDKSVKEYNIADLDSISLTAPEVASYTLGPNLLVNPGFEDPDNKTATPVSGWTILETAWLNNYYDGNTNTVGANNGHYGPEMDATFFGTGNGSFFTPYITGKYVFRTTANNAGGFYQVISGLTPGDDYFISIDMGLRRDGGSQIIREDESLKIVRNAIGAKEDVLIYEVPIPIVHNGTSLQEEVRLGMSGIFTVPPGVTEVRFLFDKRNAPGQSGLYMWDNCKFQKVLWD